MKAYLAPVLGGAMSEQWYHDISETPDQAVLLRDMEQG